MWSTPTLTALPPTHDWSMGTRWTLACSTRISFAGGAAVTKTPSHCLTHGLHHHTWRVHYIQVRGVSYWDRTRSAHAAATMKCASPSEENVRLRHTRNLTRCWRCRR